MMFHRGFWSVMSQELRHAVVTAELTSASWLGMSVVAIMLTHRDELQMLPQSETFGGDDLSPSPSLDAD